MNTVSHLPQTPVRYDAITRLLHWVMALGFIWIFAYAIAHNQFKESAFDAFMWPTHKPVGLLLMSLFSTLLPALLGRNVHNEARSRYEVS